MRGDAGHVDRRGCENMGSDPNPENMVDLIQRSIGINRGIFLKIGNAGVLCGDPHTSTAPIE